MIEGLTPTNQFAFVHGTNKINSILKDGYLHPSELTGVENFLLSDSVFMGFVSPKNKAPVDFLYKHEFILILKPEIYRDYKDMCFFNNNWNWGKINEETVYYKDFEKYTEDDVLQYNLNYLDIVMKDKRNKSNLSSSLKYKKIVKYSSSQRNELVVKSSIPLDKYLIGILTGQLKRYTPVINNAKKENPKYKDYWVSDNPELQKYVEKYVSLKKFIKNK
jgi:hypothetical protein